MGGRQVTLETGHGRRSNKQSETECVGRVLASALTLKQASWDLEQQERGRSVGRPQDKKGKRTFCGPVFQPAVQRLHSLTPCSRYASMEA